MIDFCIVKVFMYVFTNVQSKFSSLSIFFLFFFCFYLECAKSADKSKNVHFSSSLGRPRETSRRNTVSRHRDNVHVYYKLLV